MSPRESFCHDARKQENDNANATETWVNDGISIDKTRYASSHQVVPLVAGSGVQSKEKHREKKGMEGLADDLNPFRSQNHSAEHSTLSSAMGPAECGVEYVQRLSASLGNDCSQI